MRRLVPWLVPLALGIVPAPQAYAQEVRGTVFEAIDGRRMPSAGAFVIVHWTGRRPGFFHYESVCIQAAIARTDAQGEFRIAEPPPLRSTFLVFRNAPAVAVYKPGFEAANEPRPEGRRSEWSLARSKVDPQQRALFVEGISQMGCRDENYRPVLTDPQGVLPAFRAALEGEMPPKR
jgi:hypothetical protein